MSKQPAITLWQPWASLTMLRTECPGEQFIKRYETRGHRAPSTIIGKRVWIHAAKKLINSSVIMSMPAAPFRYDDQWYEGYGGDVRLTPLGALVGSALIGEPLPMLDEGGIVNGHSDMPPNCVTLRHDAIWHHGTHGDGFRAHDITDQMPYGHWEPGRWAWPLIDPQPLAVPIPAKGAQGVWYTDHQFPCR